MDPLTPDETGGSASDREGPPEAPQTAILTAELPDGRRYLVRREHIEVLRGGRVDRLPLDDPARPVFARLPVVATSSGESLRSAAFRRWARHVRSELARERRFEAPRRPQRLFQTALAIAGGATVTAGLVALLVVWSTRPRSRVNVEPTTAEALGQVLAVIVILLAAYACAAASVRAFLLRNGSHVMISRRGVRVGDGEPWRAFDTLSGARHDPVLRIVRLSFDDGAVFRLPAGDGPFRRLDLVLTALSPPLERRLRDGGGLA